MVSGRMTKLMDMAFILMLMGLSMRGIGRMICNMDMEWRLGLMDRAMKDSIKRGRSMGRGVMCGVMAQDIQETG